jgi:hypothetical protein
MNALKNSTFFDANVPGNLGPVLVTESQVISPGQIMNNASAKAIELVMLAALHYGERDAMKLIKQILNGVGSAPARQQGGFTPKRLHELTYHGTEKYKSLGFGEDKTQNMTIADLGSCSSCIARCSARRKYKSFCDFTAGGRKHC